MTNVRKEKFIELHAHLDGSITVDIARKLAALQGLKSDYTDEQLLDMISVPPECRSLTDFLKCFDFPLSLLQTKEAVSEAVRLVLKDMALEGVAYAEIRFAPQLHTAKGLSQREVIDSALDGLDNALNNSDIRANLILCCMRGKGNDEANEETVRLASEYISANRRVAALDLAGAEGLYPTENYKNIFKTAKDMGVPFTIHAGEAAGADSIRSAIEMGAARIGHGIRAYEDKDLMRLIRDKGICLEMCPTSNRLTGTVTDMENYPLREFLDFGIKVTVNTDDSAIVRTDIRSEFEYAAQLADLSDEEVHQIKINAVNASFADGEDKDWMRRKLQS